MYRFKRRAMVLVAVVVCIFALQVVNFFRQKYYLIGSDAYYYLALADGIIQTGQIENVSVVPSTGPSTPQIGIAVIMAFLKLARWSNMQVIFMISWLNLGMLALGVIFTYRLAALAGLDKSRRILTVAAVMVNWQATRLQLLPINDGIFITGLIAVSYLFFKAKKFNDYLLPTAITLALVHFRINIFFMLIAFILAWGVTGQWKKSIFFLVLMFATLGSFHIPRTAGWVLPPKSNVYDVAKNILFRKNTLVFNNAPGQNSGSHNSFSLVKELILVQTPDMYLFRLANFAANLKGINVIFAGIFLVVVYRGIKGIISKQAIVVYLAGFFIMNSLFLLVIGDVNFRYLLSGLVFSIILIFLTEQKVVNRPYFSFFYVFLLSLYSIYSLTVKPEFDCTSELLIKKSAGLAIETGIPLISQSRRQSYVFLNTPHHTDNVKAGMTYYVLGDEKFLNLTLVEIGGRVETEEIEAIYSKTGKCALIKVSPAKQSY